MIKKNRAGRNELLGDYRMLDRMSKDLRLHQKSVKQINRRIARRIDADFRAGLVEDLDIVVSHMRKASIELDKAKKRLKGI